MKRFDKARRYHRRVFIKYRHADGFYVYRTQYGNGRYTEEIA